MTINKEEAKQVVTLIQKMDQEQLKITAHFIQINMDHPMDTFDMVRRLRDADGNDKLEQKNTIIPNPMKV